MARSKYNRIAFIANAIKACGKSSSLDKGLFEERVMFYRVRGRITIMGSNLRVDIETGEQLRDTVFYSPRSFSALKKTMGEFDLQLTETPPVPSWGDLLDSHDPAWVKDTADVNALPPDMGATFGPLLKTGDSPRPSLDFVFSYTGGAGGKDVPGGWVYTNGHFLALQACPGLDAGHNIPGDVVKLFQQGVTPAFSYVDPRHRDYVSVDAFTDTSDTLRISAMTNERPPASSSITAVFPDMTRPRLFTLSGERMAEARLRKYDNTNTRLTALYDENRVQLEHKIESTVVLTLDNVGEVDSTDGMDIEVAKLVEKEQEAAHGYTAELLMAPLSVNEACLYEKFGDSRSPLMSRSYDGEWWFLVMPRRID